MQTQPTASREGRQPGLFARPGKGAGAVNRISVQFEAGPSAAGSARTALIVLEDRLDTALLDDVRLLVSELVTNSVRHSDIAAKDPVELDIAVDPRHVRVEVRDRGTGFEPRPRQPGQSQAGGWGLYLVEQIADRWAVECDDVTRVWFEVDLARMPGAEAA